MPEPRPTVPARLHPLAREILETLARFPESAGLVLGGGVALQHYCDHRATVDLDGWWAEDAAANIEEVVGRAMRAVAESHRFEVGLRSWRETRSWELKDQGKKVFALQVSLRTITLDPPLESAWSPVKIESFRDNLASKMSAVVDRGAPRDLIDVYEVCRRGLASTRECWELWRTKHPGASADEARVQVLRHVAALETRRPLERIPDASARESAQKVRAWFKNVFCRGAGDDGD